MCDGPLVARVQPSWCRSPRPTLTQQKKPRHQKKSMAWNVSDMTRIARSIRPSIVHDIGALDNTFSESSALWRAVLKKNKYRILKQQLMEVHIHFHVLIIPHAMTFWYPWRPRSNICLAMNSQFDRSGVRTRECSDCSLFHHLRRHVACRPTPVTPAGRPAAISRHGNNWNVDCYHYYKYVPIIILSIKKYWYNLSTSSISRSSVKRYRNYWYQISKIVLLYHCQCYYIIPNIFYTIIYDIISLSTYYITAVYTCHVIIILLYRRHYYIGANNNISNCYIMFVIISCHAIDITVSSTLLYHWQ